MIKPRPEDELQRLRDMYGSLADEELLKIVEDADSLAGVARQALDGELCHRTLAVEPEQITEATFERNDEQQLVTIAQYRDLQPVAGHQL